MRLLYLAVLTGIPMMSWGQSINKTDLQPRIGESYIRHRAMQADSVNPGNPGTGQLWDLSKMQLVTTSDYYYRVIPEAAAPYQVADVSYVIMNYPLTDTTMKGHTYCRDTADGYYDLADVQQLSDTRYLNPDRVYKFPLAPGDTVRDAFCFSLTVFSSTNTYCGNSRLMLDGTGTLVLPGTGLLQNIIRLKYETGMLKEGSTDSVFYLDYFWYRPGIHHPLAQYSVYREKSGYSSRTAFAYSLSNSTSISGQQVIKFNIYPNPCDQVLDVQVDGELHYIGLTDLLGNEVEKISLAGGPDYRLDTSELPDGLYILLLKSSSGTRMAKISVRH